MLIVCENRYSKRVLQEKKINKNEVIVIGSPYAEDNILEKAKYHDFYLKKIKERHFDKQLIYISHRRETAENLAEIKRLGFEPLSLNEPIELYLLQKNELPAVITGFYSAAILNLKKILIDSEIASQVAFEAHRLKTADTKKILPAVLTTIYQQYEDFGITII